MAGCVRIPLMTWVRSRIFPLQFLLCLIALLLATPTFAQDIAILLSGELPVYHKAVKGFRSGLSPSFAVHEYVLGQPMSADRELGRRIRASNPDLVFAVGGKAAHVARIEIVDQPVVFCLVLNPEIHALPSANMTGILMTVPSKDQLASMRTVLPKLNRVGLVYSLDSSPFVFHAQQSAKDLGLTLVATPITRPADLPGALRTLLPQVDALWLLRDPTVVNVDSLRFLMRTALDFNVPVFGFSSGLMRHGALATFSLDYQLIGRQAASLARDILRQDLTKGRSLPSPQPPAQPQLALNLNAAEFLGVTPSTQSMQLAAELFGGPGAFAKHDTNELFFIP